MKSIITIIALLSSVSCFSQRYLTDDFPVLDSLIGSTYGNAVNDLGENQNLLFDFYEPANDLQTDRPLIIYIHGGGFVTGSRTYPSVQEICRRMAHKGYAVANIDYRLASSFDIYNSSTDRRAMTDAMHDAKQAIRYFKANADTYQIDPSLIFIGGESAGAVTSMMASFVDKQSEMNVYPMASPNDPVGSSANANFSNSVKGALCLCGMILDTLAMEAPTDPSILWTHGTEDDFIPIALAFNTVIRAANVGIPIAAKAYEGANHCPWYYGNPNWSTYLDSTIVDITSFIYPQVTTSVNDDELLDELDVIVYPNPFQDELSIRLNKSGPTKTIKLYNYLGELIFEIKGRVHEEEFILNMENIDEGIYFLMIEDGEQRHVRKIMKFD